MQKDVLAGKNSLLYSFSNGLGKTGIGLWAYYLNSPVNLLLPFVEKSQITAFIDMVIAAKMAACAGTMSFFLRRRFDGKIPGVMQFLLACGYAWSVYNWSQCSNFMWLEGVYLLPLMLLGVYQLVRLNRRRFLAVITAVSILTNWYTAGINCLFAILWFLFEMGLMLSEEGDISALRETAAGEKASERKSLFRFCADRTFAFGYSMLTGVLLSAALFWPVILDIRNGKGTFDWDILNLALRGNVLSSLKYHIIGGISTDFIASLFCGSAAVTGLLGLFLNRHIRWRTKLVFAAMLLLSVMLYYWQPLYVLFSLLKSADSYFYRYSYVTEAFLVMGAGYYFARPAEERNSRNLFFAAIAYAAVLCAIHILDDHDLPVLVFCTALMTVITGAGIFMASGGSALRKNVGICLLAFFSVTELLWNGVELSRYYSWDNAGFSDAYNAALEAQIGKIKDTDGDFYRITQTSSKEMQHEKLNTSASNCNGLGYGYAGIASYTSCSDSRALKFLNRGGYRTVADCASMVNTSILPLDSLLGTRYILSPYDIRGYEKTEEADETTKLAVYRNPFALPMAFAIQYSGSTGAEENPFEYVNEVYTSLNGGENVRVFVPAECDTSQAGKTITYTVTGLDEETLLYGTIPMKFQVPAESSVRSDIPPKRTDSLLEVNGVYTQGYSGWVSPSVFLVPVQGKQAVVTQTLSDFAPEGPAQFYKVDFRALEEAAAGFRNRAAAFSYDMRGRRISLRADGNAGEMLFLSVPWNEGWTASVNGKRVEIEKIADTFMGLPMSDGVNEAELVFHLPGAGTGILLSLLGIVMFVMSNKWGKHRERSSDL
ncbi:MAG: YfhO family protein [Clostridium sp.]|nr:YfhO family protein [Clostridium sp.]